MRAGCQRRFSRNHHPIDQTRGTAPNAVGAPHRGAPPGRPEGKKSRPAVVVIAGLLSVHFFAQLI